MQLTGLGRAGELKHLLAVAVHAAQARARGASRNEARIAAEGRHRRGSSRKMNALLEPQIIDALYAPRRPA